MDFEGDFHFTENTQAPFRAACGLETTTVKTGWTNKPDFVTCAACQQALSALAAPSVKLPLGRKLDEGKDRWDLLPLGATKAVVQVLTKALGKYVPWSWRHVENPVERYHASMMRHIVAWRLGEANDPEDGLHHLAHAGASLLFLLSFELGVDGTASPTASLQQELTQKLDPVVEKRVCLRCSAVLRRDTCWCGSREELHGKVESAHPFIPFGCSCGVR